MTALDRKLQQLPPGARQRLLQMCYAPDAVHVLTDEPEKCGDCGELHHLFVSRDGSSRCWHCDDKREVRRQRLAG